MHFAAFCYVNESVKNPGKYYHNNVGSTINLLESMVKNHISNLIFSSSCATYGEPLEIPITEGHPQDPINPYGRSKLMVEQILADMKAAHGLEYISLRYFNAAGADPEGEVGEDHTPETHLIPLVLQTALGQRDIVQIFGNDYPTEDKTCVRDYIHVNDIAQAHLLALERLLNGRPGGAYNLGNGGGYSVRQVIETAQSVTGRTIPVAICNRRSGDPAILISASDNARNKLGWQPEYTSLHGIIETAWQWHQQHPGGFKN
jgi:UDP-glucose-4-epimerase GalE